VTAREVAIHYRRLPGRETVFRQRILEETPECVVTWLPAAELKGPVTAAGATILEPGAPVIWFTYPGRWHDIGLFHLRDGTFTGVYANILTPVRMEQGEWHTTDLMLDVWMGAGGEILILDEEEFDEARRLGWLDDELAGAARGEAERLKRAAAAGEWPPPEVHAWSLQRVARLDLSS
jgi:predicted RNA-binding protein associated with RNAse of E/G family